MKKRAIIVVDLQNEYLPEGKLPLTGLDIALKNAARVISAARANAELLIHVRHESGQPGAKAFVPGTDGVHIIPSVAPTDGEPVIIKNYPNSFRDTSLQEMLVARDIEELVVIGAMSHMCIEATARAGADLGYTVTVVHDACATKALQFDDVEVPAQQVHATAMAALSFAYATVITTDVYLELK